MKSQKHQNVRKSAPYTPRKLGPRLISARFSIGQLVDVVLRNGRVVENLEVVKVAKNYGMVRVKDNHRYDRAGDIEFNEFNVRTENVYPLGMLEHEMCHHHHGQ